MKIENERPCAIYRTSDLKVLARFPEGLFKGRPYVVKIEYDPDFENFWKNIQKLGGITLSDLDAKKYEHLEHPPFVPYKDPYFALAFFNDYFMHQLSNPTLAWKYLD